MPFLASRIAMAAGQLGLTDGTTGQHAQQIAVTSLRSFYFDLALITDADVIAFLTRFCGPDHVLVGTDAPFAPADRRARDALLERADLSTEKLTANAMRALTRHGPR